jgi:hypothetical protein
MRGRAGVIALSFVVPACVVETEALRPRPLPSFTAAPPAQPPALSPPPATSPPVTTPAPTREPRFVVYEHWTPPQARFRRNVGALLLLGGGASLAFGLAAGLMVATGSCSWGSQDNFGSCFGGVILGPVFVLVSIPLLGYGGWAFANGRRQIAPWLREPWPGVLTRAQLERELARSRRWMIGGGVGTLVGLALVATGIGLVSTYGGSIERYYGGISTLGVGGVAATGSFVFFSAGAWRRHSLKRALAAGPLGVAGTF